MYVSMLFRSSIGKKVIMAITGVIWVGYLTLHMYGNLKVFNGAVYFNHYAENLREIGAPIFGHLHLLTIARIVFVVSIALHIWAAVTLTIMARKARPDDYKMRKVVQAKYASITMRYGGVAIGLFLLYHLAHFTWGSLPGQFVRGDAYGNLVAGFQNPVNSILYLIALVAVGMHLYHGTWSMFQTLGINNKDYDRSLRGLALALGVLIPVGFALVPIAVMFRFIS